MDFNLYCIRPHEDHSHTHTVVFLHGRDSTATNLSEDLLDGQDSRGRHLQNIFPSVRWVFVQSNRQFSEQLGREINQWFNISDIRHPDDRPELQVQGLRESTAKLVHLIRSEATTVGGLSRVILAGFCQGFAVAIHALFHYPDSYRGDNPESENRLGAIVGLSGWIPLPRSSVRECRADLDLRLDGASDTDNDNGVYLNTPVFLTHSANDDVVPVEQGRRLRDILTGYGMDVTYLEYERGGHWIYGRQELDDIVDFLKFQGLPEYVAAEQSPP